MVLSGREDAMAYLLYIRYADDLRYYALRYYNTTYYLEDLTNELFIKLKKSGVTVPFQDGIISYLAIKHNCKVWTKDCHFKVIQSVIPILDLL